MEKILRKEQSAIIKIAMFGPEYWQNNFGIQLMNTIKRVPSLRGTITGKMG
jgi:hypothetical protein